MDFLVERDGADPLPFLVGSFGLEMFQPRCAASLREGLADRALGGGPFRDSWLDVHPASEERLKGLDSRPNPRGNTFPTSATGVRDPSRPDRVLHRRGLATCGAGVFGAGGSDPPSDHGGVVAWLVESRL